MRLFLVALAIVGAMLVAGVVLASDPTSAPAAAEVASAGPATANYDVAADPQGFAQTVMGAAKARQWGFVITLVILALLGLARKFGGKIWSGLATDIGGAFLALAFALVMPIAVVLGTGVRLTWPLYVGAVTATAAASGLWSWVSKIGGYLLGKLKTGE